MLGGLGQPVTTTTDANGAYSFSGVAPGGYCVAQDQPLNYNSVSDTDGPNDNIIGNVTPITVTAGNNHGGNDFIEIELGVISGHVLARYRQQRQWRRRIAGRRSQPAGRFRKSGARWPGAPIQVASGTGGYLQFHPCSRRNLPCFAKPTRGLWQRERCGWRQ